MELKVYEKLIVLAHRPQKGGISVDEIHLSHGLSGAILLQLSLEDLIKIDGEYIKINPKKSSNDQMLREVLEMIRNSRKVRKASYWVSKLGNRYNRRKKYIIGSLEQKMIIRSERKRFLGLIPYTKTYLTSTSHQTNLINELRSCILHKENMHDDNIVMLGLVEACEMQKVIAKDKYERKQIKAELKQILNESPIARSVNTTIKQVQAAVIASIVASTAATTVVATS
jgi:hypothetical protein